MNLTLTCTKIQENKRLLNFPIFLHVTITSLPQLLAISLANIYNKADHTHEATLVACDMARLLYLKYHVTYTCSMHN